VASAWTYQLSNSTLYQLEGEKHTMIGMIWSIYRVPAARYEGGLEHGGGWCAGIKQSLVRGEEMSRYMRQLRHTFRGCAIDCTTRRLHDQELSMIVTQKSFVSFHY
jgi:hypothetical protein